MICPSSPYSGVGQECCGLRHTVASSKRHAAESRSVASRHSGGNLPAVPPMRDGVQESLEEPDEHGHIRFCHTDASELFPVG